MTTMNHIHNTHRPSTPVLTETTNVYEDAPCTPPHQMIPLVFSECPPTPRPRKRVYKPSRLEDLESLFLPSSAALVSDHESDHEAPELWSESTITTTTNSHRSNNITARPAPKRLLRKRRMVLADLNRDDSVMVTNENQELVDPPQVERKVRIDYRPGGGSGMYPHTDLFDLSRLTVHDKLDAKLWSASSQAQAQGVAKVTLKRRNSYNALCA